MSAVTVGTWVYHRDDAAPLDCDYGQVTDDLGHGLVRVAWHGSQVSTRCAADSLSVAGSREQAQNAAYAPWRGRG
jgi:hypothetical protein